MEVNHHYRYDRGDTNVHHDRERERKKGVDLLVAIERCGGRKEPTTRSSFLQFGGRLFH
jgi:hypothetical protein